MFDKYLLVDRYLHKKWAFNHSVLQVDYRRVPSQGCERNTYSQTCLFDRVIKDIQDTVVLACYSFVLVLSFHLRFVLEHYIFLPTPKILYFLNTNVMPSFEKGRAYCFLAVGLSVSWSVGPIILSLYFLCGGCTY